MTYGFVWYFWIDTKYKRPAKEEHISCKALSGAENPTIKSSVAHVSSIVVCAVRCVDDDVDVPMMSPLGTVPVFVFSPFHPGEREIKIKHRFRNALVGLGEGKTLCSLCYSEKMLFFCCAPRRHSFVGSNNILLERLVAL